MNETSRDFLQYATFYAMVAVCILVAIGGQFWWVYQLRDRPMWVAIPLALAPFAFLSSTFVGLMVAMDRAREREKGRSCPVDDLACLSEGGCEPDDWTNHDPFEGKVTSNNLTVGDVVYPERDDGRS